MPNRSTDTEFPSSSEKPNRTQGRYGALNVRRPKKFMRTNGFLLAQTYTSMIVNAWPRNNKLTKNANPIMASPPNRNIMMKSEDLPRKLPSSSILQYLYVKIMLNKKLNPKVPKKRKVVTNRQTCHWLIMSRGLKYNWNGDTTSNCTANVVITQAVVYILVTGGISR